MPFADLPQVPWRQLVGDPLVAYPAGAALLLVAVALAGGLARGDVRALAHGRAWLAVALGVLAAFALALVDERLAATASDAPWLAPGAPDAAGAGTPGAGAPAGGGSDAPWWSGWPGGLRRLPLYVLALGYGPTIGMVGAALFLAVEASVAPIPGGELVLLVECAVVAWFGLAPSPYRHRWAAPLDAALGWLLAWATAGTALLAATHVPLELAVLREAAADSAGGVAASALLLALLSPAGWRALFPDSRLAPIDEDGSRTIEPLEVRPPARRLRRERWPAPRRWPRRRRPPRRGR